MPDSPIPNAGPGLDAALARALVLVRELGILLAELRIGLHSPAPAPTLGAEGCEAMYATADAVRPDSGADAPTIESDIDAWAKEIKRMRRSDAYLRDGPAQLRRMSHELGWRHAREATSAQVIEWISGQTGGGHTQNNRLAYASRFFVFCWKVRRSCTSNPCDGIERSPEHKGDGVRDFSADEMVRIVAAANGHWRTACVLMASTGLRRGAVFRGLRWGFYDRAAAELKIPVGFLKNKRAQSIPLNDDAVQILADAVGNRAPDAWIVPSAFDLDIWRALLKRAGVAYIDERGRVAGTHSFRKGVATVLARAPGVHVQTVQGLLGHADVRQTMAYTRLGREDQAAAVRLLHVLSAENSGVYGASAQNGKEALTAGDEKADDVGAKSEASITMLTATPTNLPENARPRGNVACSASQTGGHQLRGRASPGSLVGHPEGGSPSQSSANSPTRTRIQRGSSLPEAPTGIDSLSGDQRALALKLFLALLSALALAIAVWAAVRSRPHGGIEAHHGTSERSEHPVPAVVNSNE